MRRVHKILMALIGSIAFMTSCSNETQVIDSGDKVQKVQASKEDKKQDAKDGKSMEATTVMSVSPSIKNIVEKIEELHPEPYKFVSKDEIVSKGESFFTEENGLDKVLNIRRFLALYEDPSIKLVRSIENREKLDLSIKLDTEGMIIQEDKGDFKKGDKIVKISDVKVSNLVAKAGEFVSGGTKEQVYCQQNSIIKDKVFIDWATGNNEETIKVEVLRKGIPVVAKADFIKDRTVTNKSNDKVIYEEFGIGVLDISSFNGKDDANTKRIIDSFFNQANVTGVKKIVVNLSDAEYIDYSLIGEIGVYLNGGEYALFNENPKESKIWEKSKYNNKNFIQKIFKKDKIEIKGETETPFSGEVFVALNGESSYDALMIAYGLTQNFGGEIVGATPWKSVNGYGNVIDVEFKEYDVTVQIPTTSFEYSKNSDVSVEISKYSSIFALKDLDQEKLNRLLSKK